MAQIICKIWAPSFEVGLKSNENIFAYSHNICATAAPVGISSQHIHYCISQGSQLGKIDDYFSLLVAFIPPPIDTKLASRDDILSSGQLWFLYALQLK